MNRPDCYQPETIVAGRDSHPLERGAFHGARGSRANAAVCPFQIGEIAQYVEPKRVYDDLKALDLRKSEYETTKEFEARGREAMNHEMVTTPHLLRATYFPDNLTYVAEREEFIIKQYAWANLRADWDCVFGGWGIYDGKQLAKNPWGIEEISGFAPVQGVGLISDERVMGTYTASNAMGATAEVTEIERNVYAVFDEKIPPVHGSSMDPSRESWKCELKSGQFDTCSVRLSVEREKARSLKEGLSVGIVARPKPPLAATGTMRWTPKMQNPRDITAHYRVIVADILCAVLSGPDGRIVKTIEANP